MEINGTIIQYFEWLLRPGFPLWEQLKKDANQLIEDGFTAVWIPPCYKAYYGQHDVGYSAYDLYDLGEFNQKGTIPTKYGNKEQLLSAIKACHDVGLSVYADVVFNHKMGADDWEKVQAKEYHQDNRTYSVGKNREIHAWTKFNFPTRNDKYSNFKWNWSHFDSVDYDDKAK